ncbi:MAG: hypothetical protein QM784_21260 [Polyangiaceae bacterium]
MLFNHPSVGRAIDERVFARERWHELSGLGPLQPRVIAEEVLAQINRNRAATSADRPFRLSDEANPRFFGFATLRARTEEARHLLLLDPAEGSAIMRSLPNPKVPPEAPFSGEYARPSGFELESASLSLEARAQQLGLPAGTKFHFDAAGFTKLRFEIVDPNGRRWNAEYSLANGRLDGVPSEGNASQSVGDTLAQLHTTHHYPTEFGLTSLWAFAADLTGLALMGWALSGLLMWWQRKKDRVCGLGFVVLALLGMSWMTIRTTGEVHYGRVAVEQSH